MINKKTFILLSSIMLSSISFADSGYLNTSYSNTLKSGKGECIHSSSFDSNSEKLSECNNNQ
jgi:hypothetical protein